MLGQLHNSLLQTNTAINRQFRQVIVTRTPNGILPLKIAAKQGIMGCIEAKPKNNTWTTEGMQDNNKPSLVYVASSACARWLYRQNVGGKVQTL
ncbi:MAG: hypothetical protein DRI01_10075 [Chloroflexi bacterium]|nr:MAG: hypothetical protein DRI01_10075 [Chloroflexota bacterium]